MGERRERGREVDRTCRHFVCWGGEGGGGVKRGRCMLIEFSAGGGRDASTKSPQTDQDGRQSPQKKCTLIITTFFRTKRLVFSVATHGHMSERRPSISSPSVALTLSAPIAHLLHCVAFHHRALSLRSLPSHFLSARPHLSRTGGIFENLPPSHRHSCRPLSGNWKRRAGDSRRRPLSDQRMSRSSWKKLTAVQMSSVDTGYCRK